MKEGDWLDSMVQVISTNPARLSKCRKVIHEHSSCGSDTCKQDVEKQFILQGNSPWASAG